MLDPRNAQALVFARRLLLPDALTAAQKATVTLVANGSTHENTLNAYQGILNGLSGYTWYIMRLADVAEIAAFNRTIAAIVVWGEEARS